MKEEKEPLKNPCAAHPEVEACASCPKCAKACCPSCLVTHGRKKELICSRCMAALAEKLKKSAASHELLQTALVILAIAGVVWGLQRKLDAIGIAAFAGGLAFGAGALVTWLRQKGVEAELKVELFRVDTKAPDR